jgi:tRNA (guanine37-N1)-methyltransferase
MSTASPIFQATILTLFPEIFPGPLGYGVCGRALAGKLWQLNTVQLRDYATDAYGSIDDTPYGGGAGMVIRPEIAAAAWRDAEQKYGRAQARIVLSPRGQCFDQAMAAAWAEAGSVMIFCSRYEGLDQRMIDAEDLTEVSLGDFVLAGGEVAALAMLEATIRLLSGVVGNPETLGEESFSSGLLEYPHYTRPAVWEGREVPPILRAGNHAEIKAWRLQEAMRITRARRPDLWHRWGVNSKRPMK